MRNLQRTVPGAAAREEVGGKGLDANGIKADSASGSVNGPECSAAKCAALPVENGEFDLALQEVVERWAILSDEARAAIMAVVRKTTN